MLYVLSYFSSLVTGLCCRFSVGSVSLYFLCDVRELKNLRTSRLIRSASLTLRSESYIKFCFSKYKETSL